MMLGIQWHLISNVRHTLVLSHLRHNALRIDTGNAPSCSGAIFVNNFMSSFSYQDTAHRTTTDISAFYYHPPDIIHGIEPYCKGLAEYKADRSLPLYEHYILLRVRPRSLVLDTNLVALLTQSPWSQLRNLPGKLRCWLSSCNNLRVDACTISQGVEVCCWL